MDFEPKTIEEQIECLARLTGASASFISQVKELFVRKGISLHSEAAPYVRALEEAFRREERIRINSWKARQNVSQLNRHFSKLGEAYVRKVEGRTKEKRSASGSTGRKPRAVSIPGDHRTYITKTQHEDGPIVPGPSEIQ